MLTDPQIERYARHVLLREVGGVGQERLLAARVAVVGLGPVGAWAAAYLALAGVGRLDVCDDAPVAPGELPPLLDPEAVGRPRAATLAAAVSAYNPDVRVRAVRGHEAVDAVVVTDPAAVPAASAVPVVLALAAGDRALAGALAPGGPCAACLARALEPAAAPAPAAALLAGSLAATEVLARLAANATPPPGFWSAGGGALHRLDPASIGCVHRR